MNEISKTRTTHLLAGLMLSICTLNVLALPEVQNIQIDQAGPFTPGETITATYDYVDSPENDAEEDSELSWYSSPNSSGIPRTLITSFTGTESTEPFGLTIQEVYRGLYIGFSVDPRDETGETGTPTYTNWVLVNALPVATDDEYENLCNEGASRTISAPGVLDNDNSGGDGQSITASVVNNPSYGSLSLNANGSFTYTHNNSENFTDFFTYEISDGVETSSPARVDITITPVNDNNPVLTGITPSILDYTEDDPATIVAESIQVSDADNDTIHSATITIVSGFNEDEDRLSITTSELTQNYNQISGELTLTGIKPSSVYQSALRLVRYRNVNADDPSTTNRIIRYRVNDGDNNSNTPTRTIRITAVNDAPEATPDSYSGIPEGGSLTTTIGDDNHVLSNDNDVDDASITAHLVDDVSNGYLNLNSNGTFTYEHDSSEVLSDAFTYYAFDGEERSDTVTVTLSMAAENDPPLLDNIETDTVQYTEDDPSKLITATTTVTDPDDTFLQSATISIISGFEVGEDSLVFPVVSGLTIAYDTLTGILTATGQATKTVYQNQLLRNIRYWNTNTENPSDAYRVIEIIMTDDEDDSEPVERVVKIIPQNDPPMAEDATLSGSNFYVDELITATYTFTDPDGDTEGSTEIRWYTATDEQGSGAAQILGWTTDTFTIRYNEGGRYLFAVIRPRDPNGTFGIRDTTDYHYVNAVPELENFTFINEETPGAYAVGETMIADFTYADLEDDPEGTHSYQWYRSNTNDWDAAGEISGEIVDTFQIRPQDNDRYIGLEARPTATDGSSPGEIHRSPLRLVSTLPTAGISNTVEGENDSICNDGTTQILTVTLGGNNPPWSFAYTINGEDETVINDIPEEESSYELEVSDTGTYELVWVSDDRFTQIEATVSGSAHVAYYENPTATLPEAELAICDNDDGSYGIPIELTGTAPWQVSYEFSEADDSTTLINIDTAYIELEVGIADSGIYNLLHVWDAHCFSPAAPGNTEVLVKQNPYATLTGDTAVCPGEEAPLVFKLEGQGPWILHYTLNDGEEIEEVVANSSENYIHEILVSDPGIYEVVRVENGADQGCAYGSIEIENHEIPTASIAGYDSVCDGASTHFDVTLETGTAPWSFYYSEPGESDPLEITGISGTVYPLEVDMAGTYQLDSVGDANGCIGEATGSAELKVNLLPVVTLSIGRTIFTSNEGDLNPDGEPIDVTPAGGNFNASSAPGAISATNNFLPTAAYWIYCRGNNDPAFDIRYTYRVDSTGCSNTAEQRVNVLEQAAEITIVDSLFRGLEMYCFNFDTIELRGVNLAGEEYIGTFSVTGGSGIENVGNNIAYLYPWQLGSGNKEIRYDVNLANVGDPPAIASATKTLNFEVIEADFVWDNECFDEDALVHFYDTSSATQNLVESKWSFYVDNDTILASEFDTNITYTSRNTYEVEHIVFSELEGDRCSDTIRKEVVLKPTHEVRSIPYDQSFDEGADFWTSAAQNEGGINTWRLGLPEGALFEPQAGEVAWYTHITNNQQGENSYIISPCYDFRNSQRPMIKMDLWRTFTNAEGAVLQYTTNNGVDWHTLGAPEDGIEWYNSYSTGGSPGGQGLGWTRQNGSDTDWQEARHKLDELNGLSGVRFRLAYGAINNQIDERDGIAFDNVWIGERSKNVLVEYFTNTTSTTAANINEDFNNLVNREEQVSDIIDLHYYLNPNDPFYANASQVYSARSLYYDGIADVPFGIIDGGRNDQPEYLIDFHGGEELEANELTRAALADNLFDMEIQTIKGGSQVEIDLTLNAKENLNGRELSLHVVIAEEVVRLTGASGQESYESVVKTMLPNAIGTELPANWIAEEPEQYNFNYEYDGLYDDSQLRIIAYIQDEANREVLQAVKINPNVANDLDAGTSRKDQLCIYPNPAHTLARIEIGSLSSQRATLELLSIDGSLIANIQLESGQDHRLLDVSDYQPGLYLIRLHSEQELVATEKLIILE